MTEIVIIGAGQAGSALAIKLRKLGFDGKLTLIGEESTLPYRRPPLSKSYLLGEMPVARLALRPREFYDKYAIDLRLGTEAMAIDRAAKTVTMGDDILHYDQLALTTGSIARGLPADMGDGLAGVYRLRSLLDADAMLTELTPNRRVLIIGGGYIGLEVAAASAMRGLRVTVVEVAERILHRVASAETADYFRTLHRRHGVTVIEGVGVMQLDGTDRVERVRLADGDCLEVDFVVVGIGIMPATALADLAGLAIADGIRVDAYGRSSDESIWAAGDCAAFPYRGRQIRLESVPHAIEQAECVAANMLAIAKDGLVRPYLAAPWFWSDQYDVKLQIAGLNTGYDVAIRRPGRHGDAFSVWYYRGQRLCAVDAINDPQAYMIGKKLIAGDISPPCAVIGDGTYDLKALLTAEAG